MVEDANSYPRQIPNPDLLPEGWKTIEYMYKTGNYVGKTYTRFQSIDGRFKHILSVKAAVKTVAEANGEDVEKVLEEFDRKKKDMQMLEKMGNEAKRKEAGIVKGQDREDAIEEFRSRFGDLTGGMVASFPGWTSHAKLLENCGQVSMTYFDETGKSWKLIKDIQAYFGLRLKKGEDMPWLRECIESAGGMKRDYNPARANITSEDPPETVKKMKREAASVPEIYRLSKAYTLRPPQGGGNDWIVTPENVFDESSLDLKAMSERLEKLGYTCKRGSSVCSFSGPARFKLNKAGELLVDGGDQKAILQLAELYCGTWLLET
mmetsp:Transcript_61140/g.162437  ORF Transcript_61140/g.162437 Transcript_61140/m.162437 type:complete len:320 (-) Transcript_61140:107-1066(-)